MEAKKILRNPRESFVMRGKLLGILLEIPGHSTTLLVDPRWRGPYRASPPGGTHRGPPSRPRRHAVAALQSREVLGITRILQRFY